MSNATTSGAARSPNRMARTVGSLDRVPPPLRSWVRSKALGRAVRFAGTAGLEFRELSPERVVVAIANRGKVQNHIGGVHAAAMALLAETATGFVVGMNLPDDKLPLIKTMSIDYLRRAQGGLVATAQLAPEQIERLFADPKGEVLVPVEVRDESGEEPIRCAMTWAWIPKKR
ncbi:MAG: DUF4442 domain-containing protein [Deltaproteobacteria bacterium]|nr:DUF4442 domain-containing protein [Deltaproteobacteria bacterium]